MPSFLAVNFPVPVAGSAGATIGLDELVASAFGSNAQFVTHAWLAYYDFNSLKGNGGNDQIFANNGDDYTSGGDGNDTITMGLGNDNHDFRNGEDIDTILDFTAGGTDDYITLKFYTGLGSTSFDAAFQARLSTVSGHAELALNGGDRIIFQNVASHTLLTAADFVFV